MPAEQAPAPPLRRQGRWAHQEAASAAGPLPAGGPLHAQEIREACEQTTHCTRDDAGAHGAACCRGTHRAARSTAWCLSLRCSSRASRTGQRRSATPPAQAQEYPPLPPSSLRPPRRHRPAMPEGRRMAQSCGVGSAPLGLCRYISRSVGRGVRARWRPPPVFSSSSAPPTPSPAPAAGKAITIRTSRRAIRQDPSPRRGCRSCGRPVT